MESKELELSSLGHTWILDLDGTIVKHNGYIINGHDIFLDGAKEFLEQIPVDDIIIFLTSRTDEYRQLTIDFLKDNGVRYNYIIFNAPYGERILMNDDKPTGLKCGIVINVIRDSFTLNRIIINDEL